MKQGSRSSLAVYRLFYVNLKENGNMGRIVDLVNPKTDEIIPSVISRDCLTNELVAYRAEYMKIPDKIKGIKLDDHQKQTFN